MKYVANVEVESENGIEGAVESIKGGKMVILSINPRPQAMVAGQGQRPGAPQPQPQTAAR